MKTLFVVCAATAMLVATPAFAGHCDAELDALDQALATAWDVEQNAFDAAEAVREDALKSCDLEAAIAAEDPESPLNDPTYISLGQSMLIAAQNVLQPK